MQGRTPRSCPTRFWLYQQVAADGIGLQNGELYRRWILIPTLGKRTGEIGVHVWKRHRGSNQAGSRLAAVRSQAKTVGRQCVAWAYLI